MNDPTISHQAIITNLEGIVARQRKAITNQSKLANERIERLGRKITELEQEKHQLVSAREQLQQELQNLLQVKLKPNPAPEPECHRDCVYEVLMDLVKRIETLEVQQQHPLYCVHPNCEKPGCPRLAEDPSAIQINFAPPPGAHPPPAI